MTPPFFWAHRGASSLAPENTLSAFAAAFEGGADGLELDIHLSADGVPVVIHDETLERTTDGCGPVSGATFQQLGQLDAGSWFSDEFAGEAIPSLDAVLQLFGGKLRLNLELKEFDAGVAVLDLLKRYPSADIVVSSFNYELLRQLREVDKRLPLAVLFEDGNWGRAIQLARNLSACAFHPAANKVNRLMLAACTQAELPVYVWTVDSERVAKSLLRIGVAGFFANDPEALAFALRRFEPSA